MLAKDWNKTKVTCVGSLEYRFSKCDLFLQEGKQNIQSWMGRPKVQKVKKVGKFISKGGVVCGFCKSRPFYIKECDAHLFQMYPSTIMEEKFWNEILRLAIHMGEHLHPHVRCLHVTWLRGPRKL